MSVQAQKGNKILRISEDAIEKYLGMGYSIVDADGTVLKKAVPTDNNQLKLEYTQLTSEIESLKATISSLEMKNKALMRELEEAKAVTAEKPTTTRKRKQTAETTDEDKSE